MSEFSDDNPYLQECGVCSGNGDYWDDDYKKHRDCHQCNGTGKTATEAGQNILELLLWTEKQ